MSAAGVSLCIVSYNGLEKLRACLRSVQAQQTARPYEVVLVDNASAEPVAATVRAEFSAVRVTAAPTNLGFAAGTNLAVSLATQPLLWLLNPDTVLPAPDTLERLCAGFEVADHLGALGCRLVYPDGRLQVLGGIRPTVWQVLTGRPVAAGAAAGPDPAPDSAEALVAAPAITGAALLTSRAVWDAVGPLDAEYFMYFEDLDWCRRAAAAGWRLAAAPGVTVVHHEGASYGDQLDLRREHFWRSFLRYTQRHDGRTAAAALRAGLLATGLAGLGAGLLRPEARRPARLALRRAQLRLAVFGR